MKKARLTKILIEAERNVLSQYAGQIEKVAKVKVEAPPTTGLVMTKTRDSVSQTPFYLGEVLVTECTVSIDGMFGMGVIMGDDFERSYQLAVIDAAYNAGLPLTSSWEDELVQVEKDNNNRKLQEWAKLAQTRVHFDTMEDYNDKS
ncbi:phosphonate C-P lyase system protein PhnG [Bacillus horti]|uniref:Alpha-D-ribose 1-methylphosphonate 5-triphosphate synthase subunit PhnG n=1 Tax=Caldalkalibacillus horti TaxID=77523 RepID=A0ABT9W1A0_9BACI|nr:phosphonate C-P lyase system protein PhnG [Bacillus horti]MDQ0167038.1 alpha-D-ribose 1-methylphosphonate 5-triphosphate synthase subunit PhnG [Bacillus horti]